MPLQPLDLLPAEQFRIIKQINIVSDYKYMNNDFVGSVIYARKFTNRYKLKQLPGDENKKGYNPDYPEPERFPYDEVDEIIFNAIKSVHSKSTVHNSLKLFQIHAERLKHMATRPFKTAYLSFTPDLSGMDIYDLSGVILTGLQMEIRVYNARPREIDEDSFFNGYFARDNHTIIDKLAAIEFL